MIRRLVATVVAAVAALAVLGPVAAAQEEPESPSSGAQHLAIQRVDSTNPSAVEMVVSWSGSQSALESATITENGEDLRPSSVRALEGSEMALVLVIDNGDAMLPNDAFTRSKRALQDLVESRPAGLRVGVVSIGGGRSRVVQRPTNDTERLVTAIEALAATGSSAPADGLHSAARMLETVDVDLTQVLLVAGGAQSGSIGGTRARGAVSSLGPATWVVGLEDGRGVEGGYLRSVVNASGGQYHGVANPSAIGDVIGDLGQRISQQYVVSYASGASGPVDLVLDVGGDTHAVSFVLGSAVSGATALAPIQGSTPGGIGFLVDNGRDLGIALAVVAAFLAVLAVGLLIAPDRSGLDTALEVYTEGVGPDVDDDDGAGLARTALIQRAVGLTEQFAERQGLLAKVEATLERADLPLRAAEALFFYAAGVVLTLGMAFVLTEGNLLGTVIVTALIGLVPPAIVNFLASRRQKKFQELLPDTLQLLAGTLRAGYSLMQGVEAVSREVDEPMGKELRRVVTEARLGRPLEEALDASATRMDSADFAWAVMAIRIQREVGGNLAELLVTVADTMIERERLRRDVSALTAEGRVSAIVLGALPVGLGIVLYTGNPDYIGTLFEERVGQFMLIGAVILAGIGFYWMKKVIEVDI